MNLADFTWVAQAALIGTVIAGLTLMVREMFNRAGRDEE